MSSLRNFRTLFLSDLHLGTHWCKAKDLARFLSLVSCDTLYLVGDIVDGWKLRKRSRWPQSHNKVIRKLLKMSKDTRICYITGNHDDFLDEFDGYRFGHIEICRRALHETIDGRKFAVIHGDELDMVVKYKRWIARLGDVAYDAALWLNAGLNAVRSSLGLEYWSLSSYLKHKVKDAVNFISDFEDALITEAARSGTSGIICGHIHRPDLRTIGAITYANCGDWVESCSALVEHTDGRLEILWWHEWLRHLPRSFTEGELGNSPETADPAVVAFPLPARFQR